MKGDSRVSVRENFEEELTELQEKMMSLVQFTDRALDKSNGGF